MKELLKAKKGTPEYEEWLRKFREKRGHKPETEAASILRSHIKKEEGKKDQQLAIDFLSDVKNSFGETEDERIVAQNPLVQAAFTQDFLKAEQSPVFANLFGHYPVEPLVYKDREVTSPVEQIDVALANEPDFISDEIWNSPDWIATEKVDGCRGTMICTPEATRFLARRQQYSEKPSTDYTNNVPHLRDLNLYEILGDTVIDTELVASNPLETVPGKKGDSLASTITVLKQTKNRQIAIDKMNEGGPVLSFAFDIQRFQGKDIRNLPYSERMKYLDNAMALIGQKTDMIKQVARQKDGETKQEFFRRVTADNGEGLVLAKADHPYIPFDRTGRLKAKRQVETTLQIMGVEEGKGRNANTAGNFIMGAVINGTLTPIASLNVGSDELRKEAWENKDKFMGKLVEVKAMQFTTPKKGELPKLRHPRWKTPGEFRDDKTSPDDLSDTIATLLSRTKDA